MQEMSLFKFVLIKEETGQSDCLIKKGWSLNAICTECLSKTMHTPFLHACSSCGKAARKSKWFHKGEHTYSMKWT